MKASFLLSVFLDLLFPPRCVFCESIIAPGTKICRSCARTVVPVETVRRMNLPAAGKNIPCAVLYPYMGSVRESILRFKFEGEKRNADYYAERMATQVLEQFRESAFDLVTSVPLSAKRKKERGYNQSELIARRISERLRIPYAECLSKEADNAEQHRLKRNERKANVKGAYRAADSGIQGKRILMIDDIMTTGATLSECASVLFAAGAESVFCAVVAETPAGSIETGQKLEYNKESKL